MSRCKSVSYLSPVCVGFNLVMFFRCAPNAVPIIQQRRRSGRMAVLVIVIGSGRGFKSLQQLKMVTKLLLLLRLKWRVWRHRCWRHAVAVHWLAERIKVVKYHSSFVIPRRWISSLYSKHYYLLRREAEKKEPIVFLCASLLTLDRNWWIFSYTLRNVEATIPCIWLWHALRILRNNEIETINTSR